MADRDGAKPGASRSEREERLARALRENLRRRKEQQRERGRPGAARDEREQETGEP